MIERVFPPRPVGWSAARVGLLAALVLVLPAATADAQRFDLDWHTFDSGGVESALGNFTLSASAGQADANLQAAVGGDFTVRGGFWPAMCSQTGVEIFRDGFETGNLSRWSSAVGTKRDERVKELTARPRQDEGYRPAAGRPSGGRSP